MQCACHAVVGVYLGFGSNLGPQDGESLTSQANNATCWHATFCPGWRDLCASCRPAEVYQCDGALSDACHTLWNMRIQFARSRAQWSVTANPAQHLQPKWKCWSPSEAVRHALSVASVLGNPLQCKLRDPADLRATTRGGAGAEVRVQIRKACAVDGQPVDWEWL